ncbi:hypothetical protein GPDM_06750 [Planococcus donghaensis MPA1U2]|uniref:Lipoprotein n=1 Tax=Planococcus donghaensis MPA1U2 TaxID=933115 RepID=E7RFV2_9BACL|nr:hypothetical protein [Planococcus donghaensis]EGA90222.1 hypothetical protein GPDM_06750 [Planococcus donghaensis MPA1U2]
MKTLKIVPIMFLFLMIAACSDSEESVDGEFMFGNMYGDSLESNKSYYIVLPFEWTGERPVVITSVELVKENEEPVTFGEDGIEYEFYGADPLKQTGLYSGNRNIGEIVNINGFELQGESRIVAEVRLGEVVEDENRAAKINFTVNDEEYQEIVDWDTFKVLTTNNG